MAGILAFWGIFVAILAEKWPYRAYNARFGHFLGKAGRKRRGFRARGRFRLWDMGVGRRERQWRGVREGPTEDPVKNGACLTNVRPRRGL